MQTHPTPSCSTEEEQQAWDVYAAAALRGLMSKQSYVDSRTFHDAAQAADRMMEERKKRATITV